jgi:hypothetical protein
MQTKPSNFMPQGRLKFIKGSAVVPEAAGFRYILQIVNDHGHYVGKFAAQVSKRWPTVDTNYRQWYRNSMGRLRLGSIQVIQVQSDTVVINMVAAHGVEPDENETPPIRYDALDKCLDEAGKEVAYNSGSVHIPRFGALDESGAQWEKVQAHITEQLLKRGINVTVYDPAS